LDSRPHSSSVSLALDSFSPGEALGAAAPQQLAAKSEFEQVTLPVRPLIAMQARCVAQRIKMLAAGGSPSAENTTAEGGS